MRLPSELSKLVGPVVVLSLITWNTKSVWYVVLSVLLKVQGRTYIVIGFADMHVAEAVSIPKSKYKFYPAVVVPTPI